MHKCDEVCRMAPFGHLTVLEHQNKKELVSHHNYECSKHQKA